MLNKRERYKVLQFIKICSNLGPLPLQVDLESWQLKTASTWKQWISILSYILFLLHVAYKSGSLAYVYLFLPDVQLHHLVLHANMAMASILVAVWYDIVYLRYPALFATFVKITLVGNIAGPLDRSEQMEKEWRGRLKEYSLQDFIATGLPYMIVVAAVFIIAAFIYDPSMTLLLYAALPNHLQNWATFGLCLAEEFRFLLILLTLAVPVWQLQVISFDLVSNQLQAVIRNIQKGTQTAGSIYKFLRCFQLYVSMFNKVNSYLIFTWKVMCILICIISGYAAIAHFHEHPVFGSMYYVLLFDGMVIYAVIYQKAFKIPQLFEQTAALAVLQMDGNGMERKRFRKQIMSIPPTGIKIGHFHMMERASTLIFMNYVVVNIVNMLVAYG